MVEENWERKKPANFGWFLFVHYNPLSSSVRPALFLLRGKEGSESWNLRGLSPDILPNQ